MDLLGRIRGARSPRHPGFSSPQPLDLADAAEPCGRCGARDDRLLDPGGTWFVCTRCGARTDLGEGS